MSFLELGVRFQMGQAFLAFFVDSTTLDLVYMYFVRLMFL